MHFSFVLSVKKKKNNFLTIVDCVLFKVLTERKEY